MKLSRKDEQICYFSHLCCTNGIQAKTMSRIVKTANAIGKLSEIGCCRELTTAEDKREDRLMQEIDQLATEASQESGKSIKIDYSGGIWPQLEIDGKYTSMPYLDR